MANYILRDAFVSLNGVNLSTHVDSVEMPTSREDVNMSSMGDEGVTRLPGLKDESLTINFLQDHAASQVDATLWPLYDAGTKFAIEVRPTSAAVSAANPKWTGNGYLMEYQSVGGAVGSRAEAPVSIVIDGILTRAIA